MLRHRKAKKSLVIQTFFIYGKLKKLPTATGIEIGITVEVRRSMRGEYTVVVYNRDAQQFIIDNIDSVIGLMNS